MLNPQTTKNYGSPNLILLIKSNNGEPWVKNNRTSITRTPGLFCKPTLILGFHFFVIPD